MAELRWNPLLEDWVMTASHRQKRPNMPEDWCPFCPGSGKVSDDYNVLEYDNDYPTLSQNPPEPDDVAGGPYKTAPSYGKCEVILYSPQHTVTLPELPTGHIEKLITLWSERFTEMAKDSRIKYIFIFENRGEQVGVTMPHPHGQIYGYPYIPLKIRTELNSSRKHYNERGRCLICDIVKEEQNFDRRVIIENKDFITFLPFFTEYPYGLFISAKNHKGRIIDFDSEERRSLAEILKETTGTLDRLFSKQLSYMMCMHQTPVNVEDTADDYYHFHIEFYPPARSADQIKWNASSETGAWAPCNPSSPEEKAGELREAYRKYLQRKV